jgi:hypothetical protein
MPVTIDDIENWVKFLVDPNTTLEMVKNEYRQRPRLDGFMVEDLELAKCYEVLDFLASVDAFCMGGRSVYEQLTSARRNS